MHQTNGGGDNNIYYRARWANNNISHNLDVLDNVGYLTGSTLSVTVGAGSVDASGRLTISHSYLSGSFSGMHIYIENFYGSHTINSITP